MTIMWNYGTNWSTFSSHVEEEHHLLSIDVNNLYKLWVLISSYNSANFWNFCMFILQMLWSKFFLRLFLLLDHLNRFVHLKTHKNFYVLALYASAITAYIIYIQKSITL